MKLKDLTGQKYKKLTVVKRDPDYSGRAVKWICQCECGNIISVFSDNLKRGKSKSCGSCNIPNDLTGQIFGRLTVLGISQKTQKHQIKWLCRCDCGNTKEIITASLKNGSTTSCGCRQKEVAALQGMSTRIHGESKARLYKIWQGMKRRVHNPHSRKYKNYGGRGISICQEWDSHYEAFRDWALTHGYNSNAKYGECTIDRINVNGNYEPSNCRWVDLKIQANNKRKAEK